MATIRTDHAFNIDCHLCRQHITHSTQEHCEAISESHELWRDAEQYDVKQAMKSVLAGRMEPEDDYG